MNNKPSPSQEPLAVLNLAPATLERVEACGISTVGQLFEVADNPSLCPSSFDKVTLQEIHRRLTEHGLRLPNDRQSKLEIDAARFAWGMIILTVWFGSIDPCPYLLVFVCIALGIVLGFRAVRFGQGLGRVLGGLAMVLLSGFAFMLIVDRWKRGW